MRLDNKTKNKIIEILAESFLAHEELALGTAQTAESIEAIREAAKKKYHGAQWGDVSSKYTINTFHALVRKTTVAIILAIEEDDVEAELREMQRMQIELIESQLSPPFVGLDWGNRSISPTIDPLIKEGHPYKVSGNTLTVYHKELGTVLAKISVTTDPKPEEPS